MELMPALRIGWLNGWLPLGALVLTEGILFLVFPKEVVTRLFDRSGWSQRQVVFTVLGKLVALICLVLIVGTPLKIGSAVFVIGMIIVGLGLIGLAKALFDFKNTPLDQPVTRGIYRISRGMDRACTRLWPDDAAARCGRVARTRPRRSGPRPLSPARSRPPPAASQRGRDGGT